MLQTSSTPEERRKRRIYRKEYNSTLKALAYEHLGGICCKCGTRDNVKIRFHNPFDPQKAKLFRCPALLPSKIIRDSSVAALVGLYCPSCRLKLHYAAYSPTSTVAATDEAVAIPSRQVSVQIGTSKTN